MRSSYQHWAREANKGSSINGHNSKGRKLQALVSRRGFLGLYFFVLAVCAWIPLTTCQPLSPDTFGIQQEEIYPQISEAASTFSIEDEEQLLDDVIDQTAEEILTAPAPLPFSKSKRFTLNFNGMQVSYPTYVRLRRLQAKVMKLQRMIEVLHSRYSKDILERHEQYQRLMALYESLKPLLPAGDGERVNAGVSALSADTSAFDLDEDQDILMNKRSSIMMNFMGMRVSYPMYIRLKTLQDKAIRLDSLIRRMKDTAPVEELEQRVPNWPRLVRLNEALSKLLPQRPQQDQMNPSDLSSLGDMISADFDSERAQRKKRNVPTANFNGRRVTMPEYFSFMNAHEDGKYDEVMRQLRDTFDDGEARDAANWKKMVQLRNDLEELLPEENLHRPDNRNKRVVTMDFNGIQVTFPQYMHLIAMQKKVRKLDLVLSKISAQKSQEELNRNPRWKKLQELRESLSKLLPPPRSQ